MNEDWLGIRYRDFYDVPRAFVVEYEGSLYLFDCLFDHDLDDYEGRYAVYLVKDELRRRIDMISWVDLGNRSVRVGEVPVDSVEFDPSKRSAVNSRIFECLLL
jgi:hypothetical protein